MQNNDKKTSEQQLNQKQKMINCFILNVFVFVVLCTVFLWLPAITLTISNAVSVWVWLFIFVGSFSACATKHKIDSTIPVLQCYMNMYYIEHISVTIYMWCTALDKIWCFNVYMTKTIKILLIFFFIVAVVVVLLLSVGLLACIRWRCTATVKFKQCF